MGKPTRTTKNEPLGCKFLLLCISKLEVFTQLPSAYHENRGKIQDGVQTVKSHGLRNGYYIMYGTRIVSVLLRRTQLQ